MFYNEEFETLPRPALEALQLKRLQTVLERVFANVPFYKASFERAGIRPADVKSLDDLQRLPFTTKQDMRDSYPYGLFAAPMEEIVRIHASSGTTGKPTVVGYTRKDIETWSELMARSFVSAGAHKGDIIHNAYGYGLFTGGLGAHYGAERLGASVIPISGGNTKRQIMIMQDFGSTVLTCTPSYSLFMAEEARAEGIDFRNLKLRVGIFGAEPWSEAMRGEIWEDHFIPEIINPETGQRVAEGELGELVITTITKQGIPLIRYRTRDITSLTYEPCICGRSHARITRMSGRSDDMLIIRGVNVFPSQIEAILVGIEGVEPHYLLVVDRVGNLDTLEVQVEVDEQLFSDEVKVLQKLAKRIEKEIKDMLGVTCSAKLVEPKTIQRSEGKARRVIDNRKL
jgi:phenylacetate-CoA ligase